MPRSPSMLDLPIAPLIKNEALSAYEGWSIERLTRFFARHNVTEAPVIASDHQLVGRVSPRDVAHFLQRDETYKARAVNQSYRRATGSDMDNLDELTLWTRRAQHYCTVHQIMQPNAPCLPPDASVREAIALLLDNDHQQVFVVVNQRLVGSLDARQLLQQVMQQQ